MNPQNQQENNKPSIYEIYKGYKSYTPDLKKSLDTGWPWPLDAVQEWFEDLWNWISEAAEAAVQDLKDLIGEWMGEWYWSIWEQLYNIGADILADLYSWTKDIPEPLKYIVRFFLLPAAVVKHVLIPELAAIAKEIWDITPDWIKGPLTWVGEKIQPITDQIIGFFKDPVAALKAGWDTIIQSLSNAVEMGRDMLNETGRTIIHAFDETFNAMTGAISDALKALGDTLGNITKDLRDGLANALNSLKESWDAGLADIKDHIDKFTEQYHKDLREGLPDTLQGFGEWILHNLMEGLESLTAWLDKNVLEPIWSQVKGLGEWIFEHVTSFYNTIIDRLKEVSESLKKGDIGPMLEFLGTIGTLGFGATAITSVMGMKIMGTGIEVGELGSYIKDFINPSMISGIVLGVALGAAIETPARQYFNKLFRPEVPGAGDIKTYYLRGYIDEDTAKDFLSRRGYADDIIEAEMKSWEVIPGVRDLITFVVREVIKPEEFYDWAAKQGLNKYWAENYWEAHWVLPSFSDLREAFWRGIITKDEFRKYVVWHDYKPEPRPGISKSDLDIMAELSYKLPGRIDARWMVRWGIINLDELKDLTRAEGIHPDWIDKVADAEYLNQLLDERTRVKSEYYSSYAKGYLDRKSLENKLREVKFIEDEIKYLLDAADEAKRRELIDLTIDYHKELFKRGKITKTDFIKSLVSLGLDEGFVKRIADTLEARYIEIDIKDLTRDERNAVRSAALSLYKEGFMTKDQLRQKLKDLGYTDIEIELTVERADLEYNLDYYRDIINEVKQAYRKDLISDSDFIKILTSYGMRKERAEVLLEIEKFRKLPRPKPPS